MLKTNSRSFIFLYIKKKKTNSRSNEYSSELFNVQRFRIKIKILVIILFLSMDVFNWKIRNVMRCEEHWRTSSQVMSWVTETAELGYDFRAKLHKFG